MDIKNFLETMNNVPHEDSVLLRGHLGVGKSQLVYQFASAKGLPVMERRLSQLDAGDMIGLPWLDEKNSSTSFRPPDWVIA